MKSSAPPLSFIHAKRFTHTNKWTLASNEFLCAIILGFIPSVWFFCTKGEKAFVAFLESIMPSGPYGYYVGGLLIFQIFLMTLNYGIFKQSLDFRDGLNRLQYLWMQVGFSILGITRTIVGAILATILFTLIEGDTKASITISVAGSYTFVLFLTSCVLMGRIQYISESLIRTSAARN